MAPFSRLVLGTRGLFFFFPGVILNFKPPQKPPAKNPDFRPPPQILRQAEQDICPTPPAYPADCSICLVIIFRQKAAGSKGYLAQDPRWE
ncbi:hypothetical protein CW304_32910 [Bacillus sp. UFRGS-B20]|nr:hypothetical protein CW304_32910 [Bacillus sp. UFRGS-B20]